jgi:hypothetical protein
MNERVHAYLVEDVSHSKHPCMTNDDQPRLNN